MKSMNRKPTTAECLVGFLALALIVVANVRAVWLAIEDLMGEPRMVSTLDGFLGIWGAFVVLMAAVVTIGSGMILVGYLVEMGLRWIAWAVTGGGIARPEIDDLWADEVGEKRSG